ncbi:hypothetical protein [Bradyrhizobium sp.]|uniref:hypothetical protein n=1 Tax=Bradyrhizobium sp. TaxID=376 RepID=UPI003BAE5FC2
MVFSTHITIARPMADGDAGTVEYGHYTVSENEVTLTNAEGVPIKSGRLELGYTAKLNGEPAERVANRLVWRHYRAVKSGSDFNRPLRYPTSSVV